MKLYLLALLFAWGGLLAALYSAALWWTVRRLPQAAHPVLWTVGSYYLRLGGLGLAFYLAAAGSLTRLSATFAGFLLLRLLIVRRMRPAAPHSPLAEEGH